MQCQVIWSGRGFPGVAIKVGKFTTPGRTMSETVRMFPVVAALGPLLNALSVRS
jgi:hypothetical protein